MSIVIAAAILVAGAKAWSAISFGQTHVGTEDAYVTGDLVSISPTDSGTLAELNVQDGDFVHKGQLIARLNSDTSQAQLAQAKANALAAESQVPQAESALRFAQLSTAAAIRSSQAAISTQSAKTAGSRMQVRLSSDTVKNQVAQSTAQLDQARDLATQAQSGVDAAKAGLSSARQAVETAQRNAEAVQASVDAAAAENQRANQDLQRYTSLLAGDAVSKQQFDTVAAAATTAAANLDGAKRRTAAAQSEISQAKNVMQQAQAQLSSAQAQASAAAKQVQVSQSALDMARSNETQVGIQGTNVQTNEGQDTKAYADLATAQAGTEEVNLRAKQIATAQAQILQAKAAVDAAKIQVSDAYLYAPCDGYVVKHAANVGTSINPGQSVVTITRGSQVWVMANFKETQLTDVQEGQPAEIEVDAYPGRIFRGRVGRIIHATGSATTLLPPDNSTGNFTKVVQRVPIKIWFDFSPTSHDADLLRQGMSVQATIDTQPKGRQ
jgi:membrane fusion protein (multidrug efflux system)